MKQCLAFCYRRVMVQETDGRIENLANLSLYYLGSCFVGNRKAFMGQEDGFHLFVLFNTHRSLDVALLWQHIMVLI